MKKTIAVLFTLLMILACFQVFAESAYHMVVPGGAPAFAVSGVYADEPDAVQTIGADTIAEAFGSGEADFIIAPINAGAKLFKLGKSSYRLAAVVTWGNLVFASKLPGFTPDMINGRRLVLFGENTINASIAQYVLSQKGIEPSEIEFLAGAAETQAELLSGNDPEVVVMTAEPAITGARISDETITSFSVNELYKEITGFDGFTQAGLFIREKTIQESPELVEKGLAAIQASVALCENDPETAAKNAVAMEVVKAEKVALMALPGCNIRYMSAKDAKEQIETTAQIDLSQFGGELPADEFYYEAE